MRSFPPRTVSGIGGAGTGPMCDRSIFSTSCAPLSRKSRAATHKRSCDCSATCDPKLISPASTCCSKPLRQTHKDCGICWSSNRSEEHTSELQSLMRISYAVFCLKKKTYHTHKHTSTSTQEQVILD